MERGQGGVLNAAQPARSLGVDGKTVARYLDLIVDLLLVRRLPACHANVNKRLVKSPSRNRLGVFTMRLTTLHRTKPLWCTRAMNGIPCPRGSMRWA